MGVIRPQNWPVDSDRVDRRKLQPTAFPGDEVPSGALRKCLRLLIGCNVAVQITPICFVKWPTVVGLVADADRAESGCQYNALDPRITRCPQHPEVPVNSRLDPIFLANL